jgi:hypothetical protein
MAFKKATARRGKARMALVGGPGTGKTWTGLTFATALAAETGGAIAAIDTEHGSMSKYASEDPGDGLFTFDVEEPATFDPRDLLKFIADAAAQNYAVLLIDSYSHYWSGQDGMLEMVGGNFNRWKDVTPIERKVVAALLTFPGHVIVCMRAKTDYVKVEGRNGKEQMQKVGVKPDQREAIEFEFDVVAYMGREGTGVSMSIEKTRCPSLNGEVFYNPTGTTLEPYRQWLDRGAPDDTEHWSGRISSATDQEALNVIYEDMVAKGVFGRWKTMLTAKKEELLRKETEAAKARAGASSARWSGLTAQSPPEEWERHIDKITDTAELDAIEAHASAMSLMSELEGVINMRREELTQAP